MEAQKTIEEQNHKIKEMQPKAIFADAVSASETSILVGDLAKLICQNGYQIGQKRLFEWLRQNGYLMKCGSSRNMPTQRYLELAERWGWSRGKVQRFLELLKRNDMIQTSVMPEGTVVSVLNYSKYQGNGRKKKEEQQFSGWMEA